jgi:hypothetical protein
MDMPIITDSPFRTSSTGEIKGVTGEIKEDLPVGFAPSQEEDEESKAYKLSFNDKGRDVFDSNSKKEEKPE